MHILFVFRVKNRKTTCLVDIGRQEVIIPGKGKILHWIYHNNRNIFNTEIIDYNSKGTFIVLYLETDLSREGSGCWHHKMKDRYR